jgi:hypothetical protein
MRMCIELLWRNVVSRNFTFNNSRVSVIQGKFAPWPSLLTSVGQKFYNGTYRRCGIRLCEFNWRDPYARFKAFELIGFINANYSRGLEICPHKISNIGPRFRRPISHRHQPKIFCKIFMLLSIFLKQILDKFNISVSSFTTHNFRTLKRVV